MIKGFLLVDITYRGEDLLGAIKEAKKVAKALNASVSISLEKIYINVRPDSQCEDLILLYYSYVEARRLKEELATLKPEKK